MSARSAAQIDAEDAAENYLQVGMSPADVRVFQPANATLVAADQGDGAIDRQQRRFRLLGARYGQAEHAGQKRAVVSFSSQHSVRSTTESTILLPTKYAEVRAGDECRASFVSIFSQTHPD